VEGSKLCFGKTLLFPPKDLGNLHVTPPKHRNIHSHEHIQLRKWQANEPLERLRFRTFKFFRTFPVFGKKPGIGTRDETISFRSLKAQYGGCFFLERSIRDPLRQASPVWASASSSAGYSCC